MKMNMKVVAADVCWNSFFFFKHTSDVDEDSTAKEGPCGWEKKEYGDGLFSTTCMKRRRTIEEKQVT